MICKYNAITKKIEWVIFNDYLKEIINEEWLSKEMDKLDKILIPYLGLYSISKLAKRMGLMKDCIEEEIEVKASVIEENIYDNGVAFFENDIIAFSEEPLVEFLERYRIDYIPLETKKDSSSQSKTWPF
jgi:hypothetical protein